MEKQTQQTDEQKKDFRTTNKEFANNEAFRIACDRCNVKPTVRQASKFRMKKGKVFKSMLYAKKGDA